jgi:putative ABC transport system permease protein
VIHTLLHDVRYAVRALTKSPGYSGLVLGTMALGIAATTAVYSVIDGVILRPLPFPEGDRFVQLLRPRTDGQGGDTRISAGTLRALQDTASAFDAVEAWESRRVVLGGAESRLVMVARASPGLLPLVGGRPPMEGRRRPVRPRRGARGPLVSSW